MLGLDLRGRRIRAVAMCQARCRYSLPGRMRRPGDGWRFGAAVDIPSSENADNMAQLLRDRVRPLLGELPWHQRRVALCVPTSFMLMHTEKVPRSFTDEDLQALVRADCGQWLGVERDELLLDYLLTDNQADRAPARSLPSEPETATLHIYACRRQQLQQWLELCVEARLQPSVLDVEGLALLRFFRLSGVDHTQSLFLEIDADGISVHLLAEQMLSFSRHYPLGNALSSAMAEDSPASPHSDQGGEPESETGRRIAAELGKVLQRVGLHTSVSKVTSVLAMGEFAALPAVRATVEALGLQVSVVERPALALATAAAMRRGAYGSQWFGS
ncbi:MAG: pilus assembly protein PilM [Pseudomonadota bacterium]|nr:pilus assembly protein PilM [Pseudomonadota bacterium]